MQLPLRVCGCALSRSAFAREKHAHVPLGFDGSERVADALEDFVPVHGNLLSMLM